MDNQKTIEQQQNAIALKGFKIGAVVFVILVWATNLLVAWFVSVAFTILLYPLQISG